MKPLTLNTIENPGAASPGIATPEKVDGDGFGQTLKSAIEQVDALQGEADLESQKLAGGAGNLHETMLALEKADVAMRVAMKVRNKILDAYNEVMRMPV
ncbi:MAG: flagellar hook-basal body complex protein FliE [Archangium sp.]|nr:flagellar hook-basal body complex protein FliE [Archangium sp.]